MQQPPVVAQQVAQNLFQPPVIASPPKQENVKAWEPEEDRLIIELLSTLGPRWNQIKSRIPHRSVSSIRNRWQRIDRGRKMKEAGRLVNGTKCEVCGEPKRGHVCFAALRQKEAAQQQQNQAALNSALNVEPTAAVATEIEGGGSFKSKEVQEAYLAKLPQPPPIVPTGNGLRWEPQMMPSVVPTVGLPLEAPLLETGISSAPVPAEPNTLQPGPSYYVPLEHAGNITAAQTAGPATATTMPPPIEAQCTAQYFTGAMPNVTAHQPLQATPIQATTIQAQPVMQFAPAPAIEAQPALQATPVYTQPAQMQPAMMAQPVPVDHQVGMQPAMQYMQPMQQGMQFVPLNGAMMMQPGMMNMMYNPAFFVAPEPPSTPMSTQAAALSILQGAKLSGNA